MRRRQLRLLSTAAVAAVLFAGCETDDGEDVDELDAGFEQLEDDSGDGQPIDENPEGSNNQGSNNQGSNNQDTDGNDTGN